jgi:hypothetical protein
MKDSYGYLLKDIGKPKSYLGADIGWQQGTYGDTWSLSPNTYVNKAIMTVEGRFGSLKTMFGRNMCNTPAPTTFHPELDNTAFLGLDETQLYQSYIGILRWAVELGRIDITHVTATLAKFMSNPREGHLKAVIRVFAYLKKRPKAHIIMDTDDLIIDSDNTNNGYRDNISQQHWSQFYEGIEEATPANAPPPRGQAVSINMFCDAAHATDLITRRSTTGIIFFLFNTPIIWYAKRQNTIESSTFGSEFVALRIASELNDALRYKLRMFGIPITEPTKTYVTMKAW